MTKHRAGHTMTDTSAQLLIWAIVERACNDYMFFKRKTEIYKRNTTYSRELSSTIRFFKSDWWDCLMPNIDGQKVIERLDTILSKSSCCNASEYNKGDIQDVCEQQLCQSLEDIPERKERSEIYGSSTVNQPERQEEQYLFNRFFGLCPDDRRG